MSLVTCVRRGAFAFCGIVVFGSWIQGCADTCDHTVTNSLMCLFAEERRAEPDSGQSGESCPVVGEPCGETGICSEDRICVDRACLDVEVGAACGDDRICTPGRKCVAIDCIDANAGLELEGLRVEPAEVTVTTENGRLAEDIVFQAFGVGSEEAFDVTWSLGNRRVGRLTQEGEFQFASGAAGSTTVIATATGPGGKLLVGTARLKVVVQSTASGSVAASNREELSFQNLREDPVESPTILYPLDQARMPNNVRAPSIQWQEGGAAGDLYRVQLTKGSLSVTYQVRHSGAGFGYNWVPDEKTWNLVAESEPGEPLVVELARYSKQTRIAYAAKESKTVYLTLGSILGDTYYWSPSTNQNYRIRTGEDAEVIYASSGCRPCHTLSSSGRYYLNTPNSSTVNIYDLTLGDDAFAEPIASVQQQFTYSSFGWNDRYVVLSRLWVSETSLFDVRTQTVTPTTIPGGSPEWSPDDRVIASTDGANLYLTDVDGVGTVPEIGRSRKVLSGVRIPKSQPGAENWRGISFMSWSPDSKYIVLQHGIGHDPHTGRPNHILFMMKRDGSQIFELKNANQGVLGASATRGNFSPVITQDFDGNEYYWLAYASTIPYGNATVGSRRSQIWISAIDTNTKPSTDPSSVPFWLPGQRVAEANVDAYWAQIACRPLGDECSISSQCCSESCGEDPQDPGTKRCLAPNECRSFGQTCNSSADCCGGLDCQGNVCLEARVSNLCE